MTDHPEIETLPLFEVADADPNVACVNCGELVDEPGDDFCRDCWEAIEDD